MSIYDSVVSPVLDALGAPQRAVWSGIGALGGPKSSSDLLASLGVDSDSFGGQVADFGINAATDPLTYLGGLGGLRLGSRLGKGLDAAQVAKGPGYATTAADLDRMLGGGSVGGKVHAGMMKDSPALAGMLGELPPSSKFLGAGGEGIAFDTGQGDVLRFGKTTEPSRVVSDSVLAPARTVDFPTGGKGVYRAERMPMAERVGDTGYWGKGTETLKEQLPPGPLRDLQQSASAEGLDFFDRIPGNAGVYKGRPTIIDPGAYDVLPGVNLPSHPVTTPAAPGALTDTALSLFGGRQKLRRNLPLGVNSAGLAQDVGVMGGAAGGTGGALLGALTRGGE